MQASIPSGKLLGVRLCGLVVLVLAIGWLTPGARKPPAKYGRLMTPREMAAVFGDAAATKCVGDGKCWDPKPGQVRMPGETTTACLRCNSEATRKFCCDNPQGTATYCDGTGGDAACTGTKLQINLSFQQSNDSCGGCSPTNEKGWVDWSECNVKNAGGKGPPPGGDGSCPK